MSYTINKTDGTTFAVVLDGTLDTTTSSLDLIGKNYEGYGEALNENYVRLLESHANLTAPVAPTTGQLWYNTTDDTLTVRTPVGWKSLAIAAVETAQPGSPSTGDQWYDATNMQLNVYNGTTYDLVGPAYDTTEGLSGEVVDTIQSGAGAFDHIITKYYVNSVVVAILSTDTAFTPDNAITGFATISPGLQLSSTVADAAFTGTATNALSLDGDLANTYLNSTRADNSIDNDAGLTIGVGGDLTLTVTGDTAEIRNVSLNGAIEFWANIGGSDTKVLWMDGNDGFRPQVRAPSAGNDIATVTYVLASVPTDSEIKTAYENNADTNEFSDAEQTKLAGIDTGATDSETFTAEAGNLAIIDLDSSQTITSTLTADIPTPTTSNRAAGLKVDVIYLASIADRTVTLNASWLSYGEASPILIPTGKHLVLSLTCVGGAEADVHCAAVLEN